MKNFDYRFVDESLKIEGINRGPSNDELLEYHRFMSLYKISIKELESFIGIYEPRARLRDKVGLNVRVGLFSPPPGGPKIRIALTRLLSQVSTGQLTAYEAYCKYEKLHPFTDCNGRTGRMIWQWIRRAEHLTFLYMFHYQSLDNYRHEQRA